MLEIQVDLSDRDAAETAAHLLPGEHADIVGANQVLRRMFAKRQKAYAALGYATG